MDVPASQEPYRATKLWNEVILAFRTGMPLKRHRRRMRNYDNCFTGSDCASWLNCYLKNNPNFGPDVTRSQTVQLLQKFLKCHVIECATSKTGKTEFLDSSHLYRFVQYSPIKSNKRTSLQILLRTPLASQNGNNFRRDFERRQFSPVIYRGPEVKKNKAKAMGFNEDSPLHLIRPVKRDIPECHFIVKKLSVEEVENLWKLLVVKRVDSVLHPSRTEDFLDKKFISGRIILHNVTRISKSGVVTLLDKTDDIPHWVISAMKCLANWPNASGSGSCLPNYPGFEKDVFKVVRDFFINPQVPLVPLEFNPLIVQLLLVFRESLSHSGDSAITNNDPVVQDFNSCLGQKTSTPVVNSLATNTISPESAETAKPEFSSQQAEGRIILDDPTVMWEYPMTVCYETEFTSASPVTKVVPNYTSDLSFQSSHLSSHSVGNPENFGSLDTLSTISACSRATKNSLTSLPQKQFYVDHCSFNEGSRSVKHNLSSSSKHASLDNLDNPGNKYKIPVGPSQPVLSTLPRGYKMSSQSLCENRNSVAHRLKKQNNTVCDFENFSDFPVPPSQPCNISPDVVKNEVYPVIHTSSFHSNDMHDNTLNATTEIWASCFDRSDLAEKSYGSQTSKQCSDCNSTSINMCNAADLNRISCKNNITPARCGSAKQQMLPQRSYMTNQYNQNLSFIECLKDMEVKQKLIEVFQVLLVLLPPANRRQLHLLFRMIQKILRNGRLTFDSELPTRDYLLETFVPAIFHNHPEHPFKKTTMFHLVSFMVSECEVLFQVSTTLKEEVEIKLAEMRKGRIKYSLDDSCMLTYCELISQQQYEEQKVSVSNQALAELLENIIQDKSISEKEKKRRLKQFKINHPDVYDARFSNAHSGEVPNKAKKPLLSRFISMRM